MSKPAGMSSPHRSTYLQRSYVSKEGESHGTHLEQFEQEIEKQIAMVRVGYYQSSSDSSSASSAQHP